MSVKSDRLNDTESSRPSATCFGPTDKKDIRTSAISNKTNDT